ncbi:MAG: PAS domain-containing sensor histidine kinase [Gammaproteobacteria bacterium HGW-Gammaproteobacteria-3]|nr:MAG: PAS domain-containing sensor histidine kinase [Gammaproteobacteria bacterium HGW-Gammaproteobacteria-3]
MQLPKHQPPHKTEQLTDAFRIFNTLSQNLSDSYQKLEKQVAKLHAELAAVRSERLKTLVEKEKIAHRLQQILSVLPAAVILIDADGNVSDHNATALEFLGEPLMGMSWTLVMRRALMPVFDNPHERQLTCGLRVGVSYRKLEPDSGQIILLSDVSEMHDLQERVNQQKHLSAMGEMVASLAHQIRTPLSTAILYTSHLSRPGLDENRRLGFSRKVLERLHYLENQVDDMLMFAKEGRLTMSTFVLSELLKNIAETLQERIHTDAIRFEVANRVGALRVAGNENALRGALLNLLNNALEACPDQGLIILTVARANAGQLLISVEDNGVGMEKTVCARIFEPFYTTKSSGTGLGLAVVDSVARAHGGAADCTSVLGTGSVFTLTLPIMIEPDGILPGGFSGKSLHLKEVS